MNGLNINCSEDSAVIITIEFLGQREEKTTWTPDTSKIIDKYADIYPSWNAKLELDVNDGNGYKEFSYKDFSLDINNNLEFAPFMGSVNQYPSKKPF